MAGIRVRNIPKNTDERLLKIHFSKPKHGGGKIKEIYYPLTRNDAVVIFEDGTGRVVDDVIKNKHTICDEPVEVQPLPKHLVYPTIDVTLDAEASVIVQIKDVRDEMKYGMEISITQEQDQTYRLQGNWFQLEWAWNFIDSFMQRQKMIQRAISQQAQQYADKPMVVESEDEPGDSRSEDRTLKKPWDRAQDDAKHNHPSSSPLYDDKKVLSPSYRGDRKTASGDASRNSARESADERSGGMSETSVNMQGLCDNIGETERQLSDYVPDQQSIDERVKPNSIDSTSKLDHENRSFRTENATSKDFSGQTSFKLDPYQSLNKSLNHDNGCRQANAQHENHLSLQSQPPGASSTKSSYRSPRSDTKSSERSTKPSVDAVNQSLVPGKSKFEAQLKDIPRPYSEDQLLCNFDIRGLKVTVYYGSFLEEDTEAIVNASDIPLSNYGGISSAINRARGREMDVECLAYIKKNGNLKITEVKHTSCGGRKKAQRIMHTAGPVWVSEYFREMFTFELTQTFMNCLECADKMLRVKSLAFPAISTDVHGAQLDTSIRCVLDAILINTLQCSKRRLTDVHLVNKDAESTVKSVMQVQALLEHGIRNLTNDVVKKWKRFSHKDQEANLLNGRPLKINNCIIVANDENTGASDDCASTGYQENDVPCVPGRRLGDNFAIPFDRKYTETGTNGTNKENGNESSNG